jgi:hypothetical protein
MVQTTCITEYVASRQDSYFSAMIAIKEGKIAIKRREEMKMP